MKLAWAMIVNGVDSEALSLHNCLEDFAPYVDKLFITVTHKKGQEPSQLVYDVCNKFGAITSKFEWINDFAAARNFNFSQVPQEYTHIGWCDADDAVRNGYKLKPTIEAHPEADIFTMFYLYAFDEHKNATVVHQKTRIIKNDGCVTWYGNGIHEDFKENRELTRFAVDGIDVVHMSSPERMSDSRVRNYEIASEWVKKNTDARSYWNLGNSALGVGKNDEALEAFDSFMKLSKSDEEKYLIRQRKAEVLWSQNKFQEALDEARYAVGLKPEYPDAYHLLGKFYYELREYEKAKDMFLNGLVRPVPYYSIIVYNARDYDYQPLMNLAKTYYALNLPQLALPALEAAIKIVPADKALKKTISILKKEAIAGDEIIKLCGKLRKITDKVKLKKQLDKIPEKFRFHPEVLRIRNTNFIKETTSGKDLVIFCGHTEEEWTPESIAKKGSGGSEEAAITLAQGLCDRGWNVTVYNNCGTEEQHFNGSIKLEKYGYTGKPDKKGMEPIVNGAPCVTYRPYMSWNYRDKQDVTILWRQTKPLDWEINSKVYVDMHDVIPTGEFSTARIDKLDKVFFKSNYHRNLYPQIPDSKVIVLPNGIWPEAFPETEKDDKLIINTASPVRALTALIEVMKEVRKEVPDVKMKWAYGWSVTDGGMAGEKDYPEWKEKTLKGMQEAGIEDVGRLSHKKVAELYNKASLYVYPTGFPEIDCISMTKALASGCYPICSNYAALGEKMGHGGEFLPWPKTHEDFNSWDMSITDKEWLKDFANKVIEHLKQPPVDRTEMRKWALENYNWKNIIDKWNETI